MTRAAFLALVVATTLIAGPLLQGSAGGQVTMSLSRAGIRAAQAAGSSTAAPKVPPKAVPVRLNAFTPRAGVVQPVGGAPTGIFGGGSSRLKEIPSLRTAFSSTYVAGDGTYLARVSPQPVNYRDPNGSWRPIDNTLTRSSVRGYAYQSTANQYVAYLPSRIEDAPVRVAEGSRWIAFSLEGARGPGAASGPSDTYPEAIPGVTMSLTAVDTGLEEALKLDGPASPSTFRYRLQLSPGLHPVMTDGQGVQVVDRSGSVQFTIPAPIMFDAAGATSRSVSLQETDGPAGWTLAVSADSAWLGSPDRRWPVVVDPTVSINPSSDCYIANGSSASTNFCGSAELSVGFDGSKAYRGLVQFPVQSAVPANAEVLSASVGLYLRTRSTSNNAPISLYQLTQAWTSRATWNTTDGTSAWTTAGGTFNATAAATNSGTGAVGTTYTWYPTQLVQGWVNGTLPNDGLLLKQASENVTDVLQFDSSSGSVRPALQVVYAPWLGSQPFYDVQRMELTDHADLQINLANGNLVLHENDVSIKGTGLPLSLDRYYNSLSSSSSEVGSRWVLGTGRDVGLQIFADGSVALSGSSGYQVPFTKNADGTFKSPPGIDATLSQGSGYTLTFNSSGEKYTFTSGGYLTADTDRNGNAISFGYNASNLLTSITDTQGRVTGLAYNASNLLSSTTDPGGRVDQYSYDANGNLVSYVDPSGKTVTFAYDANHNLTQFTDPRGNATKLSYDGQSRVTSIVRVTNPQAGTGPTTTFTYNSGNTVVTDPNNHQTTNYVDAFGRSTRVVDPLGNATSTTYSGDNKPASRTDGAGGQTSNTFDANNNLTKQTSPTGVSISAAYGDSTHPFQPTSQVDAQGNGSSATYDITGNQTTTTDTVQQTLAIHYNSNGTISSSVDPNGNTTSYQYDTHGNLTQVVFPSPVGAVSYTYDSLSRVATKPGFTDAVAVSAG